MAGGGYGCKINILTPSQQEKLERGERHIFQSKKAKRDKELVQTFLQLKERGGLDNYIKKKTKANVAKDRKLMSELTS